MKITPLEIRQKSFEKNFRGYDKDEVTAFLQTLSQEWERMMDEHKELRYKLEASQEEVRKLREVESSLFKTLKTAEDTGSNMVEQAKRTADLHMKETQMKAEAIINESRTKAKSMMENAEHKSRQVVEAMEDEVKSLEQKYKMLENYRENLIADLRNIANNTLEKVERANAQKDRFTIEEQLSNAKQVVERINNFESLEDEEDFTLSSRTYDFTETSEEKPETKEENTDLQETPEGDSNKKNEGGSFFDQIN